MSELQIRLNDRRITLDVGNEIRDWLANKSYDTQYGARPLNRLVSKSIGSALADQIIRGQLRNGQEAKIVFNDDESDLKVVATGQYESEN